MHILLFIIYSFALGYGVLRMPFLRNSGIRPGWLLLFFALPYAGASLSAFAATWVALSLVLAYRAWRRHQWERRLAGLMYEERANLVVSLDLGLSR